MSAARLLSGGRALTSQFCRNTILRSLGNLSGQGSLYSEVSGTRTAVGEAEVKLSDRCVKKLKSFGDDDNCVRVVVEGGGCSGFQYKFELDNTVGADDRVFERDGVKVIVDVDSLDFIKGSTIDYEEELIRSSFRVIDNPLAEHGCSCGASFSLK